MRINWSKRVALFLRVSMRKSMCDAIWSIADWTALLNIASICSFCEVIEAIASEELRLKSASNASLVSDMTSDSRWVVS